MWLVDEKGSGPSPAQLSFEQLNTKLPYEVSLPPYFKSTSMRRSW
jgi:hypothetical protein